MPNELNGETVSYLKCFEVICFWKKEVRAVRTYIYDFDLYRFSYVTTSGALEERCDVCDHQHDGSECV